MNKTFVIPEFLHDRVYSYKEDGKIRYQFLMVASTISEFVPVRFPIETVVLPVLVKVYIPQTLSREEMEWRDQRGLYENGVYLNQTYVRDDSFDNLKLAKGVFAGYKNLKIISASNSPIIIEEGAFDDYAHINFVCPEGFELRVVSYKHPYWKKDNTLGLKEHRYAIIGDKKIFDEIAGHMSTLKHQYSFLPTTKSMRLPRISVNAHQKVDGLKLVDAPNPTLAEQLKDLDKKNFSFAKLLTRDDIVEILRMNNLKLVAAIGGKKALVGKTEESGNYSIFALCKHIEDSYEMEEQMHELAEDATFKTIPVFKDTTKSGQPIFDRPEKIVLTDYYMSAIVSPLMSDREAQEYVVGLTRVYHEFMTEKFGDIYMDKAKEFFEDGKDEVQTKTTNITHEK